MSNWQTKIQIKDEAINGEFVDGHYIYKSNSEDETPIVVKIYDDGSSADLLVVEIWYGEELGNHCWLHTYPDDALFLKR